MSRDPIVFRSGEGEVLDIAGHGTPVRLVAGPGLDTDELTMGIETLPPGAEVPVHIHDHAEEVVHILAGNGRAVLNGNVVAVEAGDTVVIPRGARHGFSAQMADGSESASGMTLIWAFPKPGLDDVFRALDASGGRETPNLSHIYREAP